MALVVMLGSGSSRAQDTTDKSLAPVVASEDASKDAASPVDATVRAFGAFQRGYYLTAMELALPRAQLGDSAAQTLLAELFAAGLGVPRNMDDAAFWYGQAAERGDPSAQFKFGVMLLEGKHVPADRARAEELMKKAADAGNAFAQFNHAQILVSKKPGDTGIFEALPYFERSAEQGIADAQYALAQIYSNTTGIPDEKRARARDLMQKAAQAGYDTAQLDYAIWLIDGIGGPKDYENGFRWMQVAAIGGNVVAQNRMAVLHINAIGTSGDPVEAGKWYILSRRAGYNDRSLDDFYQGLTEDEQKQAIEAANKFGKR
ncbi:tetratricopeptide repeat protein [Hoeflea sp. YIM 152468]|uniref:tetratricopeptide repeat protein n=1 Tax=Hoeflea sp. YIM 152468 TaxID=3031759 RepID=UPI0023DBAD06|nr:tetratricopeptide repeat protein [Hoeflea sp. YIM 152468]MDF1607915.1 tetratricopeptide repeat protein [Hoeflea sp. YIM 152468]